MLTHTGSRSDFTARWHHTYSTWFPFIVLCSFNQPLYWSCRVWLTGHNFSSFNDLISVWVITQYIIILYHIIHDSHETCSVICWTNQTQSAALDWDWSKFSQRSLPDAFYQQISDFSFHLDPVITISSSITSLKVKAFNCDTVNETHSLTEPRWLFGWIGFAHYCGCLLFLTDDVSRIWAWWNDKQISAR